MSFPFKLIYNEFRKVSHIHRNNLLKYSHKTGTSNIPNIHDFHPTIKKYIHDTNNLWRNFAENPSAGIGFKTPPNAAYRQPLNLKHLLLCQLNYFFLYCFIFTFVSTSFLLSRDKWSYHNLTLKHQFILTRALSFFL